MKLNASHHIHKNKFQVDCESSAKGKIIKLVEVNIGWYLHDLGAGKDFLIMIQKDNYRGKYWYIDYLENKNVSSSKNHH